jgi:hypothetical protein
MLCIRLVVKVSYQFLAFVDGEKQLRRSMRIQTFPINTLTPYLLTALVDKPKRLIYLSPGLRRLEPLCAG